MPGKNTDTAVILAAGLGTRLSGEGGLKPLLSVGGEPLISRTIRGLGRVGCSRVVIVTGHEAERLETEVRAAHVSGPELVFAHNELYQRQNGVSVLRAAELIEGPFLLTMADHILGRSLFDLAAAHTPPADGATLLVDKKIESVFDLDDATKVRADGSRLVEIGKQLASYNCIDTGLFVATEGLVDALTVVYSQRGDVSLSEGVGALAEAGRMQVLDIGDGQWQDVDTPEMLAEATRRLAQIDQERS